MRRLEAGPHGTWSVYVDNHPKRDASDRKPSSLFRLCGLEAVIRAIRQQSLVVVVTALPFRAEPRSGLPTRTRTEFDSPPHSQHCSSSRLLGLDARMTTLQ